MEMERRVFIRGLLAAAAIGSVSRTQGQKSALKRAETLWAGKSGGYTWNWTTADLTAAPSSASGRTAFSANKAERKVAGAATNEVQTYFECSITPLSVVGTLVSYERDYAWEGGAHPSGAITYITVDVSKPYRPLKLTDFFSDSAILKALLTDPIIQKVMTREKIAAPKTSAALVKLLNFKNFGGEDDDKYGFSEDLLSRFAFHHVDLTNGQVAVRLNISWAIEVFRFQTTQIGLLLPLPEKLRTALAKADQQQQGFLMKDAKRLAHDRTTSLFTLGKKM
jgi:hypothetical protein